MFSPSLHSDFKAIAKAACFLQIFLDNLSTGNGSLKLKSLKLYYLKQGFVGKKSTHIALFYSAHKGEFSALAKFTIPKSGTTKMGLV